MTTRLDLPPGKKTFVEGDEISITFVFTDLIGDPYDLSGVTKVLFTVNNSYDPPGALIALNSDDQPTQVTYGVAGPGAGKIKIVMLSADTVGMAQYACRYYDVEALVGASTPNTLVRGKIGFVHEVPLPP